MIEFILMFSSQPGLMYFILFFWFKKKIQALKKKSNFQYKKSAIFLANKVKVINFPEYAFSSRLNHIFIACQMKLLKTVNDNWIVISDIPMDILWIYTYILLQYYSKSVFKSILLVVSLDESLNNARSLTHTLYISPSNNQIIRLDAQTLSKLLHCNTFE